MTRVKSIETVSAKPQWNRQPNNQGNQVLCLSVRTITLIELWYICSETAKLECLFVSSFLLVAQSSPAEACRGWLPSHLGFIGPSYMCIDFERIISQINLGLDMLGI